ncbi:hypothetical protein ZWY2020_035833 [Hordeum vulgare]|nr:hypothetical protein ZWY2020_035833 [Hordeum vulgare]
MPAAQIAGTGPARVSLGTAGEWRRGGATIQPTPAAGLGHGGEGRKARNRTPSHTRRSGPPLQAASGATPAEQERRPAATRPPHYPGRPCPPPPKSALGPRDYDGRHAGHC